MELQESGLYKHSIKLESRTASLYVKNTGCQQCSPGFGWGPGVRDHFLLHHIIAGEGVYAVRDKRYELEAGDTFLVYPGVTVQYRAHDERPWEYIWVGFNGLEAETLVEQTDFSLEEPVYYGRDQDDIRALMSAVYNSCGPQIWEGLEMTSRLYALVSFLVRTSQNRKGLPQNTKDCAQVAAEYIINHYEEPISVENLAKLTSVSHSSLYRRFIKRYQISPKRFLLEYRIERACTMLASAECSIQEVSTSVGFDDPFYFSRVFKEIKGVSPRKYIGNMKEED